jgi:hypothetical protein
LAVTTASARSLPALICGIAGGNPSMLERAESGFGRLAQVLVDPEIFFPEMPHDADAHAPQVPSQRGSIVGHQPVGAAGIARVVPGNRLKQDGAVLHGPRHRSAMVERIRIRYDTGAAHEAVGGKLYDAGSVLLGKLSTHEFAHGRPSFDLPWPPARNPWNPEHRSSSAPT